MRVPRAFTAAGSGVLLLFSGFLISRAADESATPASNQLTVDHPECTFFGSQRERFVRNTLQRAGVMSRTSASLSRQTEQVARMLSGAPGGSRSYSFDQSVQPGSIDSYIFADLQANGIKPAAKTTDWEFIRRVSLDLTGRIPAPDRVLSFVADNTPDKRAKLVDDLLNSPEWVDKWTMYFGDMYQNTVSKPSSGLVRYAQGRNAFYTWIKESLANNKPYNQMATELISSQAEDSYDSGPINWLVGGVVSGGPRQDITDQMTANVADTFLGLAHVNCLLCHNGRGHLDALSLWGSSTTRYQAWELSAFLSHTQAARVTNPDNRNTYYWSLLDDVKGYTTDYALNTTTGNRPARVAPSGCKSNQPCYYVTPQYIFNGDQPKAGEDYRQALARDVTNDFQFARATVNYVWAQFFGRGIVDPPDTFDPARLDPDNPPPSPWTLQPSNARLLNALAQRFINSGYSLKSLMRDIVNSETYQLSTRYGGQWNPAWEQYFARKFVRRLWGEEIHDAIVQSSGILPSYSVTGFTDQGFPKPSYAMQLPDVVGMPGSTVTAFLDNFLRGNRDDQPRREDGSVLQALGVMNDPFIEAHMKATGTGASPLITQNLTKTDTDLVNTLFLNVLSRYPSDAERTTALAALKNGNRTQGVQDLLWSLYNKVDFIFNY
ncbi:MAG TPA: DUF1549 domain-containing protein [Bryobacteraceae bacterium]|nr:DUF1549 domain-containing protein [Bryobacteraceae bacterium]